MRELPAGYSRRPKLAPAMHPRTALPARGQSRRPTSGAAPTAPLARSGAGRRAFPAVCQPRPLRHAKTGRRTRPGCRLALLAGSSAAGPKISGLGDCALRRLSPSMSAARQGVSAISMERASGHLGGRGRGVNPQGNFEPARIQCGPPRWQNRPGARHVRSGPSRPALPAFAFAFSNGYLTRS